MAKADPAVQRLLLTVAEIDQSLDAAAARRAALPEIARLAAARTRGDDLDNQIVLVTTELADIDLAARKLDGEIDSVRQRAERDRQRIQSAATSAKEIESLQKEIVSLERRQATLEDEALELMEQRESAAAREAELTRDRSEVDVTIEAAAAVRDRTFGEIDTDIADLTERRGRLRGDLPADVLTIYDRLRGAGKVGAGLLRGDTCGACQMSLDRASLDEIRSAAADSVQRCPECSAILVR